MATADGGRHPIKGWRFECKYLNMINNISLKSVPNFPHVTATVQNCTNILCFACNVPYANLPPKIANRGNIPTIKKMGAVIPFRPIDEMREKREVEKMLNKHVI